MVQLSHTCCKHQTHVLVASNSISLSWLEGRIYIITLLNTLPALIISLNPLPVLVALKILRDIPGYTLVHTLGHDKYPAARWVSRKLRPKSKTIPCYTADCFKSSCFNTVRPSAGNHYREKIRDLICLYNNSSQREIGPPVVLHTHILTARGMSIGQLWSSRKNSYALVGSPNSKITNQRIIGFNNLELKK